MNNILNLRLDDEFDKSYSIKINKNNILDLDNYIIGDINKLKLFFDKNFISIIDKYNIKKVLIPNIKNISIYFNTINRELKLEAKDKMFKFETIECQFYNFFVNKPVHPIEYLIKSFLNSLNFIKELNIDIIGKKRLNIDLSNKILNIEKLKLKGLENIKLNIFNNTLKTLELNNVNNINIKNLKKILELELNYININKTNKKDFEYIFNNINIENLSIEHSKIKLNLLLKSLNKLGINSSQINEITIEKYKNDYFSIENTKLKNLKIDQNEADNIVCSLYNLSVKDTVIINKNAEVHIEDSNINNLIIDNSKNINLSNVFSKNIVVKNSKSFVYQEGNIDKLKINFLKLKNRKIIAENIGKINLTFYYDEIKKKFINMPKIKLNKISSHLMIKFLAEFEIKDINEDYILNYDKLLEIYKYLQDIKYNNVNTVNIIFYNLQFGIIKNSYNNEKINEFKNILEQNKEKLQNRIIRYFIQTVKDEKWLEKNLKIFNEYNKIKTKTISKIINI